uniref:ApcH n=2 Tax=Anthocerotibacter panamensis TaxID=2857077 RepID=A0AAJ6N6E9_9CYAN|nr:Chain 1, ApcH [Anthocerotibacter panamensis]8IMK_2 Chain 2, ApcH [Anthocerotibacter panamensis]
MQPIILRTLSARRPVQGRPNLETYTSEVERWKAIAQTQYALELAKEMSRPALRTSVGDLPGGLWGVRPGFQSPPKQRYRWTLKQSKAEKEALLEAIYRQVLERVLPEGSRLNEEESRLNNGDITVREFVRRLASSDLYVQSFLVRYPNTKLVEKLYKHLLGRAPSNQKEIIKYHDLLARKGLKAAVDAMVTTEEYTEIFGDDTVPFARYTTDPAHGLVTQAYLGGVLVNAKHTYQNRTLNFPSYGPGSQTGGEQRSLPLVPERVFSLGDGASVDQILRASYRQILEKEPQELQRLSVAESQLRNGEISVKEFIRALGYSEIYAKFFLARWYNGKVAEFNFKHFLGRQPASATELGSHITLIGTKGLKVAIDTLLASQEYQDNFGDDTVPYYRLQAERYVGTTDAPSRAYVLARSRVQTALNKPTVPSYSLV